MKRLTHTAIESRNPGTNASQFRLAPAHRRVGLVILAIFGASLVGCATPNDAIEVEQLAYERGDADLEAEAEFNERVRRCRQSGGYMVLPMGRGGTIDRSTMEKAYCDRDWRGLKGVLYD